MHKYLHLISFLILAGCGGIVEMPDRVDPKPYVDGVYERSSERDLKTACVAPLLANRLASVDLDPYTIESYTNRGCLAPANVSLYGSVWCCPVSVCTAPLVDHRLASVDLTPYTISYYTSSGCAAPSNSQYYGLVWCCQPQCVAPYHEHRLAMKDLTPYTIDYYSNSGCVAPTTPSLYGLIWCCR